MPNYYNKLTRTRLWFLFIILLLASIAFSSEWIVEWLWMGSLGYEAVFWKIKATKILLFVGAMLVAMGYVLPNMYMLSKNFNHQGFTSSPLGELNLNRFKSNQIRVAFYVFGTIFSAFFSLVFYMQWDSFFRFSHSATFNRTDPVFNNDIGYYVFRHPFLEMIQNNFIVLVFFITLVLIVFYLYSGSLVLQGTSNIRARNQVVRHISFNAGLWLLFLAWGYYLQRYDLLFDKSGVVYGASYTDIYVKLPVFWTMCILCILLAVLVFSQMFRTRVKLLVGGIVITAVTGFVGQAILPTAIQQFVVEPNELELETPYLQHNIEQTQLAYKLDEIDNRQYDAGDTLTFAKIRENTETLQNIRLWDPRLIIQSYRQLQEIRLYYQFYDVDVGRYHTDEGYIQVMLSARELTSELPQQADTWVNRHLQYTHGYGMVMSPVAQIGPQGDPRFIVQNLPPVSSTNLVIEQSAIYYGEHDPDYKIVNTEIPEFDYPRGDQNVYTHYEGKGGVSVGGFFEKLLFAWEFGDFNILLTDYIREGSKIQFWKNIRDRVQRIAPFLMLEDDAYLVLSEGRLYWMLDAYTTTSHHPYSEPYNSQINYIRNSVKVVVDAFHGSVEFYAMDEEDPVLSVYRAIFPDMFKTFDEMSPSLRQHLRYPPTMFMVQMQLYNRYHMTNPQVFYNNEDLWTRPNEKYGGQQIKMEPYYVLSKLPGEERLQYMLISPLTPSNRDNMIAWMTAKSDFPEYGQVEVFELPKERLILGPAQIEAMIDQDTEISRQLALWDQRGSSVIRGNLMVIPIEDAFLYVEPVFLIAEGVDIPQLQRVIVTAGERVVMEPILDQALESLFGQRTDEPIMVESVRSAGPDTTGTVSSLPSPQLERVKSLWQEVQAALRNGNWEQFGEKMKQIEEVLRDQ